MGRLDEMFAGGVQVSYGCAGLQRPQIGGEMEEFFAVQWSPAYALHSISWGAVLAPIFRPRCPRSLWCSGPRQASAVASLQGQSLSCVRVPPCPPHQLLTLRDPG